MPYFGGLGPRPHFEVRDGTPRLVGEPDTTKFERFLLPMPGAFWLYWNSALYRSLHKNLFFALHGEQIAELERRERNALTIDDQRAAMAAALAQFAARVGAASRQALVVAIPTREAALRGEAPAHAWLAARCAELALPFASLLEPLHAAPAADGYFLRDIHLTRSGHARVALALTPRIRAGLRRRQ